MATDSFKFWDSYYDALKMAPTPEDGYRLIMAICAQVFDGEEPDFSDNPILGMAYQIMAGQAIQSRDIARRGRENGKKARGVPKQRGSKGGLKGSQRGAKANRKEEKGEEAIASPLPSPTWRDAPGADAPAPAPEPWDPVDYPPPPPPPSA